MSIQRIWVFGSILLAAAILLLGWFLAIQPLLASASVANDQRIQVESENVGHAAKLEELKVQYADIESLRADLADQQIALPPSEAPDALIDEISALATRAGVRLASTGTTAAVAFIPREGLDSGSVNESNFLTMPVSITIEGKYANVLKFIDDVQNGKRLFVPDTLTFAGNTAVPDAVEGQAPQPAQTLVTVALSGAAYILIDPAHPAGTLVPVCGSDADTSDEDPAVVCQPEFAPRTTDPFLPLKK